MRKLQILQTILCLGMGMSVFAQNCNFNRAIKTDNPSGYFTTDTTRVEVCMGTKVGFVADSSAGMKFQWKRIGNYGGIDNVNGATTSKLLLSQVKESGRYVCELSKANCTTTLSAVVQFTAHESAFISLQPERKPNADGTVTICSSGDKFTLYPSLKLITTGFGETFQWFKDGKEMNSSNIVFASEAGSYYIKFKQGNVEVTSAPLKVVATSGTMISDIGSSLNTNKDSVQICSGMLATFFLNTDPLLFNNTGVTWTRNGVVAPNNPTSYYSTSESGIIQASFKRGECEVKTQKFKVIVGNKVLLDTLRPSENTDYLGCDKNGKIKLSTFFVGAATVFPTDGVFRFISQNSNQIGQKPYSTTSYILTNLRETFKATYQSGSCLGTSPTITLTDRNIVFKLKITKSETASTCGTSSVLLALNSPKQGYPTQWFRDGKEIEGGVSNNFMTNISGKYWAVIKTTLGSNNCEFYSDTMSVNIVKVSTPSPTITIDNSQCKEGVYILKTVAQTGLSYQWKKDGAFLNGEKENTANVSISGKYTLIVSDDKCSYVSNEIEVGGKIIYPNSLCLNQPFQLSYSGTGKSYEWLGSNGYKSNEAAPKFSSINFYGAFFNLKVTDNNGCVNFAAVYYYANQPANINLRVNTPRIVSEGSDTYFSFYGNFDYYSANLQGVKMTVPYQKEPILNITNLTIKNAQITTHTGYYKVEVSKDGCTYKDSVNVYVVKKEEIPVITIKPFAKKVFCNYENIKIEYEVKGFLPPKTGLQVMFTNLDTKQTYNDTRYYTENPIVMSVPYGLTGKNYAVALLEPTPFYITKTDNGSVLNLLLTPNSTTFEIKPQPRYLYFQNTDTQNSSNFICKGSKVNFLADTANYAISYQWQFNKKDIPNATTRKLVAADSGLYALNYTIDGCTIENSSSYVLNAGKTIPAPNFKSVSVTQVCEGYTVPLSVYDPGPKFQLQWKKDGVAIANATGLDYRATQSGNYTVESTGEGGCKATTSTGQQVSIGSPTVSLNYEGSQDFCTGFYGYGYIGGAGYSTELLKILDFRFQWLKDGKEIERANETTYNITESGTYQLRVEQGKCTVLSKPLVLKKTNISKAKLTNNGVENVACSSNVMFLNIIFPPNFYGNQTTYYKDGSIISQGNSTYFYPTQNGKYWAVATDYNGTCKVNSDTLTLNFDSNKTIFSTNAIRSDLYDNLCNKDTITLFGTPAYALYNAIGVYYQWFKDGKAYTKTISNTLKTVEEGNYSLEVYQADGCKSVYPSQLFKRSLVFPISISHSSPLNSSSDLKICNAMLTPLTAGYFYYPFGQTPTYQWQKDNKDITGTNAPRISINAAGTYLLKTSLGKCAGVSNSIVVTETPAIDVSISPKDSVTLCPTGKVDLKIPADKDLTYSWRRDDVVLPNTNSSILNVGEQAKYWVVARRQDCFKQSNPVQVFVRNIPPTATLTGDKQINYGDSTALKVEFTSVPPWTFKFSDDTNKILTASVSPYLRYIKTLENKTFSLASVKNLCGVGKTNGTAKITVLILGTEEANDGVKVNLFPMPTSAQLNLKVEIPEAQTLQWQLTDIKGRTLNISEKTMKQTVHEQSISVENLPAGTYLFKLEVGEKVVFRKIIKE